MKKEEDLQWLIDTFSKLTTPVISIGAIFFVINELYETREVNKLSQQNYYTTSYSDHIKNLSANSKSKKDIFHSIQSQTEDFFDPAIFFSDCTAIGTKLPLEEMREFNKLSGELLSLVLKIDSTELINSDQKAFLKSELKTSFLDEVNMFNEVFVYYLPDVQANHKSFFSPSRKKVSNTYYLKKAQFQMFDYEFQELFSDFRVIKETLKN
ncbi:hypothetical protein [Jiulongibacter sp. NS-SX5]|uniref:hypothetical protein n=1 Tax=Jiulongibacter sp. NS-SX5 TaxID=3463854 RepID=UPI004058BC16